MNPVWALLQHKPSRFKSKIPETQTNDDNLTVLTPSRACQPISAFCFTMAGPPVTSGVQSGAALEPTGAEAGGGIHKLVTIGHTMMFSVLREIQFNGGKRAAVALERATVNGDQRAAASHRHVMLLEPSAESYWPFPKRWRDEASRRHFREQCGRSQWSSVVGQTLHVRLMRGGGEVGGG